MTDTKIQNVSMKLCQSDVERVRTIARRLRVRESDVIRFALRQAFAKLAPLHDQNARGRDLIPVFLECGPELAYHFDLDSRTLESIVNGDLDDPRMKVDAHDIEILAVSHMMPSYHFESKLKGLSRIKTGRLDFSGPLQQYLHDKYIGPRNTQQTPDTLNVSLQIPL
jgi:hypothetical protein